jgi:hypothetical protein
MRADDDEVSAVKTRERRESLSCLYSPLMHGSVFEFLSHALPSKCTTIFSSLYCSRECERHVSCQALIDSCIPSSCIPTHTV